MARAKSLEPEGRAQQRKPAAGAAPEVSTSFDPARFRATTIPPDLSRELAMTTLPEVPREQLFEEAGDFTPEHDELPGRRLGCPLASPSARRARAFAVLGALRGKVRSLGPFFTLGASVVLLLVAIASASRRSTRVDARRPAASAPNARAGVQAVEVRARGAPSASAAAVLSAPPQRDSQKSPPLQRGPARDARSRASRLTTPGAPSTNQVPVASAQEAPKPEKTVPIQPSKKRSVLDAPLVPAQE